MSKHTPGELFVKKTAGDHDQYLVYLESGETVAIVNGEANAAIIAAAPDLLAACQAALEWAKTPGPHGGNPYCHEFIKLAEAAIAKATDNAA